MDTMDIGILLLSISLSIFPEGCLHAQEKSISEVHVKPNPMPLWFIRGNQESKQNTSISIAVI
jgi:hypothetical protein